MFYVSLVILQYCWLWPDPTAFLKEVIPFRSFAASVDARQPRDD